MWLTFEELSPLAPTLTEQVAAILIEDAEAHAVEAAPCILEPAFPHRASVKSILRQAVLRWHRAGEGGVVTEQETTGPFSMSRTVDNRMSGEGRLWPSEVRRLQDMCRTWKGQSRRKAYTVLPGRRR